MTDKRGRWIDMVEESNCSKTKQPDSTIMFHSSKNNLRKSIFPHTVPTPQLVNIQTFLLGMEVTAAGVVSPQRIETLQAKILELDHRPEQLQSSSID